MSMQLKIKTFFGPARQYAVVGASQNPAKFGFRILSWYVGHDLPVVPINPKEKEILGQSVVSSIKEVLLSISAKKDVAHHKLSTADGLSISFLTPPEITLNTLLEIASVPEYKQIVKGLWFQPGSYNKETLEKAEEIGLSDRLVHEDECILVRGDSGLYAANL